MCRCAESIARAVVAFLDAVLVRGLLSCFRPRRRRSGSGSGRLGALVHRDRAEEALWDPERGLGMSAGNKSHEDLTDGGDIDEEQLRQEDTENATPKLPKTWDGNGIPNTISRYREDQRVRWHTTPFEERLLKVLSDNEHCPPRKVVRGKLFHQEERAE
ncbi:unnamed protein product [Urochloa decumbens]|uniref:Uncharacterized protein n=1 Tax=Urochloa decumbens TaxID=240449 RepID=A0ABC9DJR3_9POAL